MNSKEYYRLNKEKWVRYYQRDKAKISQRNKTRRVEINETKKARRRYWKEVVIRHYGSKCICCGEERFEFLTLDHVNNDGAKERKERAKLGSDFYKWLVSHNFETPYKLQILCWNCNCSKGFYGYCPHQTSSG